MTGSPFSLMKERRFLPLFLTQFLQAFNDNMLKNALVILVTYVLSSTEERGYSPGTLVLMSSALFMLPYVIFSATAGKLADQFEKSFQIRCIKFFEIGIMLIAALGFYFLNIWILMFVIFLTGAHSAFFAALKYGILPDHLEEHELITGNAFVESSTFVAILFGTICGVYLMPLPHGELFVSLLGISIACAGLVTSFYIPKTMTQKADLSLSWNLYAETIEVLKQSTMSYESFLGMFGISWFWMLGGCMIGQFPTLTKVSFHADTEVVNFFMTIFSVGIGLGSFLCERLLKGEVTSKYVPLGLFGISFFIIHLYYACQHVVVPETEALQTIRVFLSAPVNWWIVINTLMIALCGGLYIVPLYAILQVRAAPNHRSRTMAANNILNAVFMFIGFMGVGFLMFLGFNIPQIFLILGIANALVTLYICKMLPETVIKSFVCWVLKLVYKVKIHGLENYKKAGPRAIIVANHVSFLDGLLLAAFLPDKVVFAIDYQIVTQWWWFRPFLTLVEAVPLDATNPMSLKALIRAIQAGNRCMIFPEGRLTLTGALMKIYEGPGLVADRCGSDILPIRIDGAQYSPFSRLKGKVRKRLFPRITLTILPHRHFIVPQHVRGRQRRQIISAKLYDLMTDLMFESSDYSKSLFSSLIDAKKIHGTRHIVLEDIKRRPIRYHQIISRSMVVGRYLSRETVFGENVGILLPNMIGTVIMFFALQSHGRVPAMLNYSTGPQNVNLACKSAKIRLVYTSSQFIKAGNLQSLLDMLQAEKMRIVFVENLTQEIRWLDRVTGLLFSLAPRFAYRQLVPNFQSDDPAVVLFTSGSEGVPKGVVLSHKNLQANRYQLSARIDFNAQDVVFNALPIFHAFGLTAGTIMPLISGLKVFLYPSPLHYRVIPELVYENNVTILFGTDTFLAGYARCAHQYDFYSLRYVVAGAEKLKSETALMWIEKFGLRILEGYGATETSPVLTVNTPMQAKRGTVGRFLPGIRYRVQPVPGIQVGGRLFVSAPNIMLGYLFPSMPGEICAPEEGWYDTGDIVTVDDEGFVTILGRAKRFAKIAGEMVSLTAVESHVKTLWPDHTHAALEVRDEKRGEQIILITTYPQAKRTELIQHFQAKGLSEIYLPKKIMILQEIPVLSTGKTDYVALARILS